MKNTTHYDKLLVKIQEEDERQCELMSHLRLHPDIVAKTMTYQELFSTMQIAFVEKLRDVFSETDEQALNRKYGAVNPTSNFGRISF